MSRTTSTAFSEIFMYGRLNSFRRSPFIVCGLFGCTRPFSRRPHSVKVYYVFTTICTTEDHLEGPHTEVFCPHTYTHTHFHQTDTN